MSRITLLIKWKLLQSAIADESIGSASKVVSARLLEFHNSKTSQCNPGYGAISAGIRLSRRAVIDAVDDLEAAEWLKVERKFNADTGRNDRNEYFFDFSRAKGPPKKGDGSGKKRPGGSAEFAPGGSAENDTTLVQNLHHPSADSAPGGSAENDTLNLLYKNHEEKPRIESLSGESDLFPPVKKNRKPARRTTSPKAESTPEGFEEFWAAYPLRKARGDAERAYAKAIAGGAARQDLLLGAMRYAAERDREPDPATRARFTAHAATWLNRGSWADEPAPASTLPDSFTNNRRSAPSANSREGFGFRVMRLVEE